MPNTPISLKHPMIMVVAITSIFIVGCQLSAPPKERRTTPLPNSTLAIEARAFTSTSELTPSKVDKSSPIVSTITPTHEKSNLVLSKSLGFIGYDLLYSPDGKLLASNSAEKISVFDVGNGELVAEFIKPDEAGLSGGGPVVFSPDGKTLAADVYVEGSNGTESEVYLLDASSLDLLKKYSYFGRLSDLQYSPDGTQVAGTGEYGKIYVWNIRNKHVIRLNAGAYNLAFSPTDPILASGEVVGAGGPAVILWDTKNFGSKGIFNLDPDPNSAYSGATTSVSFSPDGHILAAVIKGELRFRDLIADREIVSRIGKSDSPLIRAIYSAKGYLAILDQNGEVIVYDPGSEAIKGTVKFEINELPPSFELYDFFEFLFNMVFSPDGNQLLTGGSGIPVQVWEIP